MDGPEKLRQFGFKVSKYFLEFLETDFHRQQAPRRRIQLRNDNNQTTGVALRKYESLYRHVVNLGVDVLLVGASGELPANPRHAALLARRLLEFKVSGGR